MQWKINLTRVICLRMGKTTEAKPHFVKLRSPLPRIYYYQNKWLQVKGIPVSNTNLQLNPYPNTQLDLQCSDNLSFQCTARSMWLINWCMDPSMWLTHQLKEDVGCKVLQFIQQWRSRNSLVTKPSAQRRSSFYNEYDELGQLFSVTICVQQQFATTFLLPLTALKIIHIYV